MERSQISIEEFSKSLAYSSHILDTDLDALRFTINKHPDIKAREVILRTYEPLRDLTSFAMNSVDRKRWHRIQNNLKVISISELIHYIEDCIYIILKNLSNPEIFGGYSTSKVAKKLFKQREKVFSYQSIKEKNKKVHYHETQIYVVLLETLKNAVKNLDVDKPKLSIELVLDKKENLMEFLFLHIINSTGRPFSRVKTLAENIKYGSGEELGIMTIKMSCMACGYITPKWVAKKTDCGKGDLLTEVQIGRCVTNKKGE